MTNLSDRIKSCFSRSQEERKMFISGSRMSSDKVIQRLSEFSKSSARERLHVMRFHKAWRHQNCPVMKWYSQQKKSSTQFQVIEHRRDINGPFYHEFLLLKLIDGAICRVERAGEGSQADAIRYIGCKSNDTIQWFSEEDCGDARIDSEIISEVNFGRKFDILDVLGICYSIQRTKGCSAYTLQRYNCYFLCLTILALLARQVAYWETILTTNDWDSHIKTVLDRLSNLPPEETTNYAALRLSAAVGTDNPQPAEAILKALRQHTTVVSGFYSRYSHAMSLTLWETSLDSALYSTVADIAVPAVATLFEDEVYSAIRLKDITLDEVLIGIVAMMHIVQAWSKTLTNKMAEYYDHAMQQYEAQSHGQEIEFPKTRRREAIDRIMCPIFFLRYIISPHSVFQEDNGALFTNMLDKLRMSAFKMALLKKKRFLYSPVLLDMFRKPEQFGKRLGKGLEHELIVATIVEAVYNNGSKDISDLRLLLGACLKESDLDSTLSSFLAPSLSHSIRDIVKSQMPLIDFRSSQQSKDNMVNRTVGVTEFHAEYIKNRIDAHARRVAHYQLASGPLVYQDISKAMEDVWKFLQESVYGITIDTNLGVNLSTSYYPSDPIRVVSRTDEGAAEVWFTTQPLDEEYIANIAEIQLTTESKDQGWVDSASNSGHSRFDLAILATPDSKQPRVHNGLPLTWTSHCNPLAGKEYRRLRGKSFHHEDPICKNLAPGNCIGVCVVAFERAWVNDAVDAQLNVRFSRPRAGIREEMTE
ncbi:unnamed protein product [Rhizoctonia solani]|uniref:Uncharacterized protein n=1 Tax=Rhizoctonia solani TaxID=456999 RepID=A0A8H3CMF4_9AGAM|nr:unnamed protein product [Rhizoctonia solani]